MFILIVLLWFYILALVILSGAVVNELRLLRHRSGTLAAMPDPATEEMRLEQLERARKERDRADASPDEPETAQHERRAERAGYLEEKLKERGEAEERRRAPGGVMEGHEERAQELEYELADMEKQQDDLDDNIHAAKDEWEAKKRDGSVPAPVPARKMKAPIPRLRAAASPELEDEDSSTG